MILRFKKILLCSLTFWGFNLHAATSVSTPETDLKKEGEKEVFSTNPDGHNGQALGAVLPHGVFRTTVAGFFARINSEFDAEGKQKDLGLTVNMGGMVFALEYGVSDRLSAQMKVPVFLRNSISFDPAELRNSDKFKGTIEKLKELPSIDKKDREESAYRLFSEDVRYGTTGLGDIELGALYNWLSNENMILSTGLGLRLPTGKFYASKYLRPFGKGLFELGIQNNLDIAFVDRNLWLSIQHQGTFALNKTLNPEENPSDLLGVLDREKNNAYFSRLGMTHELIVQSSFSFEALSDYLKMFSASVGYIYNSAAPEHVNGDEATPRNHVHSITTGISASALPYKIPLALDVDYTKNLAGYSSTARETLTMKVKAYVKF